MLSQGFAIVGRRGHVGAAMSLVEALDMGKTDAYAGRPYRMPTCCKTPDQQMYYRDGWILAAHAEIVRLRAAVKILVGS